MTGSGNSRRGGGRGGCNCPTGSLPHHLQHQQGGRACLWFVTHAAVENVWNIELLWQKGRHEEFRIVLLLVFSRSEWLHNWSGGEVFGELHPGSHPRPVSRVKNEKANDGRDALDREGWFKDVCVWLNSFQEECSEAVASIAARINAEDADMRSHVVMSIFMVALACIHFQYFRKPSKHNFKVTKLWTFYGGGGTPIWDCYRQRYARMNPTPLSGVFYLLKMMFWIQPIQRNG